MDVHFFHGWGCDASIWNTVIDLLPDVIRVYNHDRGYFAPDMPLGEADLQTQQNLGPLVIVTHSMGLLHVPDELLYLASRLVIVNGFVSFCSNDPSYKKEIESVLGAMIVRTKRNPSLQIREFRKNAGFEDDSDLAFFNTERLIADLGTLKQNSVNIDVLNKIDNIIFISDRNDPIVSSVLRKELEEAFRHRAHKYVSDTKHLAPLRVPDLVVQCILGE